MLLLIICHESYKKKYKMIYRDAINDNNILQLYSLDPFKLIYLVNNILLIVAKPTHFHWRRRLEPYYIHRLSIDV